MPLLVSWTPLSPALPLYGWGFSLCLVQHPTSSPHALTGVGERSTMPCKIVTSALPYDRKNGTSYYYSYCIIYWSNHLHELYYYYMPPRTAIRIWRSKPPQIKKPQIWPSG